MLTKQPSNNSNSQDPWNKDRLRQDDLEQGTAGGRWKETIKRVRGTNGLHLNVRPPRENS